MLVNMLRMVRYMEKRLYLRRLQLFILEILKSEIRHHMFSSPYFSDLLKIEWDIHASYSVLCIYLSLFRMFWKIMADHDVSNLLLVDF